MNRILAISDIHGELEKLEKLLGKANYNPEADQLILLGDYIDRGPHASEVVRKVKKLKEQGAIVLKGNHDDLMLKAFDQDRTALEKWLRNGGIHTLRSYGYEIGEKRTEEVPDEPLITLEALAQKNKIVEEDLTFLQKLALYYETDQYIFVHGGVHPITPLTETEPHVLMWIREEFHKGYAGEKTVIFGHTTTSVLHGRPEVYFGPNNIIGIDGGAVFGGRLNCLELPSKKVYYVE